MRDHHLYIDINTPPARTDYVTRTVHEHRAPTDESVRLLREMEAAAEAKRIGGMQLNSNKFSGLVEACLDPVSYTTQLQMVFDINGHRLTAKTTSDYYMKVDEDLIMKLRDEVAKVIANEILSETFQRLSRENPTLMRQLGI